MALKNLLWIEELLPDEIIPKKMFGGVAYYLDEKFVLLVMESPGSDQHKGVKYPFDIWHGCLFPIEKIKQGTVFIQFPFLTNHPVSAKWLYLPQETEDFEERLKLIIREIKKRNPLYGTLTKIATPRKNKTNDAEAGPVDTSKPRLFSEDISAKIPKKKKPSIAKKVKANKKPENQLLLSVLKRRNR
ncbi:MAG: hypothetical protein H7061_02105 [Bdellovibrionaceae bacterium]|nr:hypothetical protein [Bdellovibrio sp.]